MSQRRLSSKTDAGTVLLHALLVGLVAVLFGTGIRIAADRPGLEWLALLDPVLPVEELWLKHMLAGVGLTAIAAAYVSYMRYFGLWQRIRLDRARMAGLLRGSQARRSTLNVCLSWILLLSLLIEIVTGVQLYLGAGRVVLDIHLLAAGVLVGAILLHVVMHAIVGGLPQLLRIVRPSGWPKPAMGWPDLVAKRLAELEQRTHHPQPTESRELHRRQGERLQAHPLAVMAAAVVSVIVTAGMVEQGTRTTLGLAAVATGSAPVIDGDLSDPVWRRAEVAEVMTTGGTNFGGSGETRVEIRGVHDGRNAYFAFIWADPTRSLKHLPLVKRADGWHLVHTRFDAGDEGRYHEDKFSVLFARSVRAIVGAAIHLSPAPLSSAPRPSNGRGYHYTSGAILDVWQWRAASAPNGGLMEDGYFGPPAEQVRSQAADGAARYAGGYGLDPGTDGAILNFSRDALKREGSAVTPLRLPAEPALAAAALGRLDDDPEHSETDGALWCLPIERSVTYSPAADRAFAPGAVIAGVIAIGQPGGDRGSVRAAGRWAAGRWTLEVVRALQTGSGFDTEIATGTMMWVAAFDHVQTRHTRHLRPIRLELR